MEKEMIPFELVDPKSPRAGSKKFSQRQIALRHLKEVAEDPNNIDHLNDVWRTKVKRRSSGPVPHIRTVLSDLANLLVDGSLRIARSETGSGGGGGSSKKKSRPKPVQRPPLGANNPDDQLFIRPREKFVPPPPGPTPNIAQQVATLIAAAKSGAAFCEVCEDPPADSQ